MESFQNRRVSIVILRPPIAILKAALQKEMGVSAICLLKKKGKKNNKRMLGGLYKGFGVQSPLVDVYRQKCSRVSGADFFSNIISLVRSRDVFLQSCSHHLSRNVVLGKVWFWRKLEPTKCCLMFQPLLFELAIRMYIYIYT